MLSARLCRLDSDGDGYVYPSESFSAPYISWSESRNGQAVIVSCVTHDKKSLSLLSHVAGSLYISSCYQGKGPSHEGVTETPLRQMAEPAFTLIGYWKAGPAVH